MAARTSYLRFPHLHGDTLVFVAENDVWTAALSGGRAYRLTADAVPVSTPRLSPDGARVAWTSWRAGAAEVFAADADGGSARRLTWWGGAACRGFSPAGDVVALTAAGQPLSRRTWAWDVPPDGGTPRRREHGPLSDLALSADGPGVLLATTRSLESAWWKRYRGGTAGKLWWDATGSGGFVRLLADVDAQLECPMQVGGRLAFLSDHEGWGNLYSVDPDGGDLRRHTDHGAVGGPAFYVRHASTDGTRVVFESAGELWILDSLDAPARRLDVRLGGPRTARDPHRVPTARWLTRAVPDRTGRSSVVTVRGTVHRLTHRDGPARTLLAEPGVRARLAEPLGADRAVWVDDAGGEEAVCVAPLDPLADGAGERVRYPVDGRVLELAAAPDGRSVAVALHDGRLLLLELPDAPRDTDPAVGPTDSPTDTDTDTDTDDAAAAAADTDDPATADGADDGEGADGPGDPEVGVTGGGRLRELARGADGEVSDLAWSPDSQWLAYADPVESGISRIAMVRPADGVPVAVTAPRFVDVSPTFTTDGRYLAFLSRRSFDPVYDEHSFDLTFPASWRPFLVPLAARTPDPFGATPDGRPTSPAEEKPDDLHAPDPADPSAEGAEAVPVRKKEKDAPPEVVVDVDGLADRVVPIPVGEARYSGMTAAKGCLLWFRSPVEGVLGSGRADEDKPDRPVLERYDLARRKLDVIADPVRGYAVSGDGTRLVVRDGETLRVLRSDRSGSNGPEKGDPDEFDVDTRRIVVTVDPTAEWRQMFDEVGRLMRDHFWVADMAGVDWAAELARYRPLVDVVGSHDDLVDVLWELHGELGTSHAYVGGGGAVGDASGRPGLLGADLERADDGDGWRVVRVLPPETSAPAARSPLAGPGVDVRAGDVLLEVAGRPVDPHWGPAPLLVGTADRLVELTVRTGPGRAGAGEVRRVVVEPLASEEELRYQDWVAGRRAFVADRSEGRIGYLHVPDMVASGWAQLHRDLGRETARDGLVLDVRGNRGGHTSQLVVEKLARRVIGWDVPRHRQPFTYPADAPRGPVVALADEHSGSDGDIVTAAIKRLGVGPVVGVRTWGGVIGIDGRYGLVDGTRVTQPRYAAWFDDTGWDMENRGVDPDVEVVVTPMDRVADRDPQLERAVDLALAALAERPAARPPDPATRPSRRRPDLPPRP